MSVASASGSPTRIARTAGSSAAMNASIALACTRIRERAQQSWPALANTAIGAAAAAASTSASAKTTLADFPPSSSVTRLIVRAAPAAIVRPTSVEPVNAIFATSGCSTSRAPHSEPGPATTLTTPSGIPASAAISAKRSAVSGVSSAGLSTTVLPAASAGASFHAAMTSGKFHGVMSPTTPRGSRTVNAWPPATGIVSPRQPLGRPRVEAERVDDHAHLAARVADRLAGVARLEHRELLEARLQRPRERVEVASPGRGVDRAPRRSGGPRPRDGRVDLLDAAAGDRPQDRLCRGLDDLQRAQSPVGSTARVSPENSTLRIGPVNVLRAPSTHHSPTPMITAATVSGA